MRHVTGHVGGLTSGLHANPPHVTCDVGMTFDPDVLARHFGQSGSAPPPFCIARALPPYLKWLL